MVLKAKDEMGKIRVNGWLIVILLFGYFDLVSTFAGMSDPNIIEANPLAQEFYNNGEIMPLVIFKLAMIIVFFAIDWLLVQYLKQWAFPIIPMGLLYLGVTVFLNNTNVILQGDIHVVTYIVVYGSTIYFTYLILKWGMSDDGYKSVINNET